MRTKTPKAKSVRYRSLADYLDATNTTQAALAARFDIDRSYVSLLVSGDRQPGRRLAVRLEKEIGVPASSWDAEERAAS